MIVALERLVGVIPNVFGIQEWLWGFLPDNCQMSDCKRFGVRGNENRVAGKVMCDYCSSRYVREHPEVKRWNDTTGVWEISAE